MTVLENRHEQGLLEFFGSADSVREFQQLKTTEQMIDYMWKSSNLQVRFIYSIYWIFFKIEKCLEFSERSLRSKLWKE